MNKHGFLFSYSFFHVAVQHERAPRSCIQGSHLANGLISTHTDQKVFSSIHHIPLQHNPHSGLFLPMPIHLPTTFPSTLDSQLTRHYSPFSSFHSNVFDSLHFAASNPNLFPMPPPPLISNDKMPSKSTIDMRENSVTHPFHMSNVFKTFSSKNESNPFHLKSIPTTVSLPTISKLTRNDNGKEDEVSSSEEIVTLHNSAATLSSNSQSEQDIVFESAAKLLILAVKWTRSIPSFIQLSSTDQNLLLEECWAELFIIMSAQYGLPIGSKFTFNRNSIDLKVG